MSDIVLPRGRPSLYNDEVAEHICRRLSDGISLNEICKAENMPAESTVRSWALNNTHGFSANYSHAREIQAQKWADQIVEIADTAEDANIARLRVDARKWICSKLLPKIYGDRLELNPDKDRPAHISWALAPSKLDE